MPTKVSSIPSIAKSDSLENSPSVSTSTSGSWRGVPKKWAKGINYVLHNINASVRTPSPPTSPKSKLQPIPFPPLKPKQFQLQPRYPLANFAKIGDFKKVADIKNKLEVAGVPLTATNYTDLINM